MHKDIFMSIWLEPQINAIEDSLMDLEIHERNCYLEHEKELKIFKVYTKTNCEHECLADFVLSRCGCVEFFMIRNFTTRICMASEKSCFDGARSDFEEHKSSCGCLQPCNYVKYDTEVVQRSYDDHHDTHYGLTCLGSFGFKKTYYNQFVRKKQFNEVDFLSFVGGLLGLFAGFSALSFVEVIYWTIAKVKRVFRTKKITSVHPQIIEVSVCNQQESDSTLAGKQNLVLEYFSESSIHGFNYLESSSIFETTFWLFAFIFSISLCAVLISQTNDKLPDSRVVSIDENLNSVGDIPFPAVSYMPYHFVDRKFAKNFDKYHLLTPVKEKLDRNAELKQAYLLNATRYGICYNGLLPQFTTLNLTTRYVMQDVIRETSKIDYIQNQFASFNRKFSVEFSEVRIYNGRGYSFNLIDFEELMHVDQIGDKLHYIRNISMNNQHGLVPIPNGSYPVHMNIKDNMFEFTLKVKRQLELDDKSLIRCWSGGMFVHETDLMPIFDSHFNSIDVVPGVNLNLEVTPEITRTDISLKKLSPKVRECYFDSEKSLRFFKIYSEKNCKIECITNYTHEHCGCVTFFHAYNKDLGIDYCYDGHEIDCTLNITSTLLSSDNFSTERNCSCLPTCNSISYNVKRYLGFDDQDKETTTINVRMRTEETILFRRYQQFTFSDVVSYVGGLLGLFAGISMLSLVELFYFFTIRLSGNFLRH